jgi:hypothetical protein
MAADAKLAVSLLALLVERSPVFNGSLSLLEERAK